MGVEEPHLGLMLYFRLMFYFVESGFHGFPELILHVCMYVRLIRVDQCYDTAFYEVESPVITHGDRVCITWKAYLRWKTWIFTEKNERGLSLRRARKE